MVSVYLKAAIVSNLQKHETTVVLQVNENHVPEGGGNQHKKSILAFTFNIGNIQCVILGA